MDTGYPTYAMASIIGGLNVSGNAGELIFSTNPIVSTNTNIERMRITSVGNVGIGRTNPDAALHVTGPVASMGQLILNSTTTTEQVGFALSQGTLQRWQLYVPPSTTNFKMYNASLGSVPFNIDSDAVSNLLYLKGGKIGINVGAPGNTLDIRSDVNDVGGINIWNINAGTNSVAGIYFVNNNVSETPFIAYASSTYTGKGGANTFIVNSSNRDFAIVNNSVEVARFTYSSGYVGIGTTNPTAKLHVNGPDTIADMNQLIIGSSTSNYGIYTFRQRTTASYAIQYLALDVTNYAGAYTNVMVWNGANVGIGTTTPLYPLQIYTNTTNWAQYVGNVNAAGYGLYVSGGKTDGTTQSFQVANQSGTNLLILNGDGTLYLKGNVGVGITNPSEKFTVSGNAFVTGNLRLGNQFDGFNISGGTTLNRKLTVVGGDVQITGSTSNSIQIYGDINLKGDTTGGANKVGIGAMGGLDTATFSVTGTTNISIAKFVDYNAINWMEMDVPNSILNVNKSQSTISFNVGSKNDVNILFVDGNNDRVGINIGSALQGKFHIKASATEDAGIPAIFLDKTISNSYDPFITFSGHTTSTCPATNSNISLMQGGSASGTFPKSASAGTGNCGWTFDKMIKINVNGTANWIPCYIAVQNP